MPRVCLGLPHPAPQHTLRNLEIAAGLSHRYPSISDQLYASSLNSRLNVLRPMQGPPIG
jgi:hypothetical protein